MELCHCMGKCAGKDRKQEDELQACKHRWTKCCIWNTCKMLFIYKETAQGTLKWFTISSLKKGWYVSVFHCPQVARLNKWLPACTVGCDIVPTVLFNGTCLLCKQSPVLEKLFPALVEHLEQGDSRTGGADKSCYAESLLIMNSDHEPESCDRSVDRSPNWHSSHLRTASNRSCMVDERECDLRTHSRTAVGSFYTLNSEHSNSGG